MDTTCVVKNTFSRSCLTSINVSHDTDITSIFQRKVSCHVFFSFQYLLNKYYRYGDALSMSHLLVNHITEHTQGNCFNLTNGSEQMLCSLQPFCECLHVLTAPPVLFAASKISLAKRSSIVFHHEDAHS